MFWLYCWLIALATGEQISAEATDCMKPIDWPGNYWGPAASRARLTGQLPPLPMTPAMDRTRSWGRKMLREGDIVFRLGDARILRGSFPLSLFIARAFRKPVLAYRRSRHRGRIRLSCTTARPRGSSSNHSRSGCSTASELSVSRD